MRRMSAQVRRGGALFALSLTLITPIAQASEPIPDPPSAIIRPPIGSTAREAPSVIQRLAARIRTSLAALMH